ncbi:MAG: glycosyltransferase family 39 protein, partial [Burkholderiales bacterium]|nr:glycosyltransferase family 39 protein [Anaerolineae bacterium]
MSNIAVGARHALPLQPPPKRTHQRILIVLAFLFLLIVAAALRLLIFDHYLPYIEDGNEQNMFLLTQHWRGVGADIYGYNIQYVVDWLHGYPPLYLWLNALTQQATEALAPGQWLFAPDYFYTARLLAALFSIVTTALVVSIGWQTGGAVAGWFAGLIWALSPIVLLEDSAAVPDPFVFFTCALSLTLALRAWTLRNPLWLFASFLAALLTILFKYSHIYVFIPFSIVTLIFLREKPKRTLAWIALEIAVGLIAAAYLVFGYGALGVSNREADQFQQRGIESVLSLDRNLNNVRMALLTFSQSPILALLTGIVVIGGIAAYITARRGGGRVLDWRRVGLLALYSVAGIIVTSGFSRVFEGNIRYVLPVTMALVILWSAGAAQIIITFGRGTMHRAPTIALLTVLVSAALLPGAVSMIQQYQL